MKGLAAVVLIFAVLLCACDYGAIQASIIEEIYEPSSLTAPTEFTETVSVTATTVTTAATTVTSALVLSETTAETTTEFLSDFSFEVGEEENTYYLTNISGSFKKITDFGIFAYYAESTGAAIRKLEIYYDDREASLDITYVNGKADIENYELWFNPLTEDIPEAAVSLSPNESCKIIILPPYGIRPPTVVSLPDGVLVTPASFVYNDEGLRFRSDTSVAYSLDHKKAAFTSATDNTLYYISAEDMEPVFIDENVHNFEMAASGDGIAYTDSESDYANLYLWDGKEKHHVTETCYLPSKLWISPDGKTVLFQEKIENYVYYCYYTDGEITLIDEERIEPIAIADGGSIIYYKKGKALYVQRYGDYENRLKVVDYSGIDKSLQYSFNTDNTEMIYADGKNTYIIKNGIFIYETSDEIEYRSSLHLFPDSAVKPDSFAGTLYAGNDWNLRYIDDNFVMHTIINDVAGEVSNRYVDCKVSRDGNVVNFKLRNQIYRYDLRDPENILNYNITQNVKYMIPTENASSIYYFTEDHKLYFKSIDKAEVLLASDLLEYREVYDYNCNSYIVNDDEMYFINGGALYFTDKVSVTKLTGDELYFERLLVIDGEAHLLGVMGEYDYILTKDGKLIA
ncbi:MAG: hypothetical protein LBL98_02465 [Ruminococcus sp.]|jgi:hypothetical protein|nr:hypothetical protein [Ruminococcus sp.]